MSEQYYYVQPSEMEEKKAIDKVCYPPYRLPQTKEAFRDCLLVVYECGFYDAKRRIMQEQTDERNNALNDAIDACADVMVDYGKDDDWNSACEICRENISNLKQ